MEAKEQKKIKIDKKEIHPIQFIGIITAIVFEFLGFLLFFGIIGYFVEHQWFKDNSLILIFSLFIGMMIGIYYMYKRAKSLSQISISKIKKESFSTFFIDREKQTKERIEKTKKDIEESQKKLNKYLKKYED